MIYIYKKSKMNQQTNTSLSYESEILPSRELCVFSVATKYTLGLHNWQESLKTQGYSYRVLGFGDVWGGWRYRMKTYRDALSTWCEDKGEKSIVILSDAYDVLFVRKSTDGLLKKFKSFQKPIVASVEKGCGINCGLVTEWWKKNPEEVKHIIGKDKYMCAGLIMGEAKALADALTWALDNNYKDDQIGLSSYVQVFPDMAWLDYRSTIFRTKQDEFTLLTKEREQYGPYALHFPSLRIAPFFTPSTEASKLFAGPRGIATTDYSGTHYIWKYATIVLIFVLIAMSFRSGLHACKVHYDTH